MMAEYFEKNAAVMKLISLFAILSMGLPISGASAATELETLRARCIEQERQIQALEAQLKKLEPEGARPAPAEAPPMAIVVPESAAEPAGKTHKIQANDTYSSISRKYNVSIESLVAANPGVKPTALRPGQVIRVVSESSTPPPVAAPPPASVGSAAPVPPLAKPEPATPSPPAGATTSPNASSPKKIRSVMIETEMTYASFATQYGTDTGRLNDLNGLDLTDTTVLAKGSELYVPH